MINIYNRVLASALFDIKIIKFPRSRCGDDENADDISAYFCCSILSTVYSYMYIFTKGSYFEIILYCINSTLIQLSNHAGVAHLLFEVM